jgi:ferrous iron transport protein B
MPTQSSLRVSLAGNPNSGKTSLFNALTGARQHVANYPGVTVERRSGRFSLGELSVELVDLPGTYSLTSYSLEERIAQEHLLEGKDDVVVVVVDSTTLRRSLPLLFQVLQTGANPVLCLNMADEARAAGQRLLVTRLEELLGFPVVETVANRGQGLEELRDAISRAKHAPLHACGPVFTDSLHSAMAAIEDVFARAEAPVRGRTWAAMRLLVEDDLFEEQYLAHWPGLAEAKRCAEQQRESLLADGGDDPAMAVAQGYRKRVDDLLEAVISEAKRTEARRWSNRLDRVLANRVLGLPVFLGVLYGLFWLTFSVGEIPMGWIEQGFGALSGWVGGLWPEGSSSPLRSLLVDGVIGGVGGVVVFLPNILLLFLGLALLEDTGYMARAAFLLDRLMHRFGLHGRSFIPLVTGFGCSIPGIMATRALDNERDRLVTMLVLPLMPCGARFPIWMLLIPAFFADKWRAPVLWGIYVLGVVLALTLAVVLRKFVLKGPDAPFVMELPPYRAPTARLAATKVLERGGLYLRKAGTVILGISVVMWVLTSYPKAEAADLHVPTVAVEPADSAAADAVTCDRSTPSCDRAAGSPVNETDAAADLEALRAAADLRASAAGRIGRFLEPALRPLGFDWRIATALIGAFAAKEVFVSQLGIIYAMGETDESSTALRSALGRDYPPSVGLALMVFLLVSAPCMSTFAIVRRESGRWSWAALQFAGLTGIAYVLALIVHQVGRLVI